MVPHIVLINIGVVIGIDSKTQNRKSNRQKSKIGTNNRFLKNDFQFQFR